MAPKVVVPADFGIENLHCEFHGNVVLKLQGGEDMNANSLILSYHSSVFVRLFLELNQSVLEMDDFTNKSVKSFLGALYSGEIQLDRELFRDVNKMCHVFKVDWLSRRCGDYFASLVGDVSISTDYQTLLFLFEEARFCLKTLKCDQLLDLVVQKICSLENRVEIFVRPYMKNYTQLDTSQIDIMLEITRKNPISLLSIVKENIEDGAVLDKEYVLHLLQNIDLCKCIHEDETLLEEAFDVILESADLSRENERLLHKLYRQASKDFKSSDNTLEVVQDLSASEEPLVSEEIEIANLFTPFESFENLRAFAFFDQGLVSPLISNFYMLIEGLWLNTFLRMQKDSSATDLHAIILVLDHIRSKRNWKQLCPEYLSDLPGDYELFLKLITQKVPTIVSQPDSTHRLVGEVVEIFGSTETNLRFCDLFARKVRLAYYLPQSVTSKLNCSQNGFCGFVLETKPVLKDGNPHKFKASISFDSSKFPDDLHWHPEIIDIEETHLMLSAFFRNDFTKMKLMPCCLIWNGNGVRIQGNSSGETWHLDPFWFEAKEPVELVIFM